MVSVFSPLPCVVGQIAGALLRKLVLVLAGLNHVTLHVDHVDLFRRLKLIDLHLGEGLREAEAMSNSSKWKHAVAGFGIIPPTHLLQFHVHLCHFD